MLLSIHYGIAQGWPSMRQHFGDELYYIVNCKSLTL